MPVASDAQLAAKLRTLSAVRKYTTVPESALRTSLCAFVSKTTAEPLAHATAPLVVRHAVTYVFLSELFHFLKIPLPCSPP